MGVFAAACGANAERNNAGNDLYSRGDYEAAVEAYFSAQVIEPDAPEAYYNAAGALAGAKALETAKAALQQALKSADSALAAKAYYNLGNVYFAAAQYQEAVIAYQETLRLRPDDEEARYNLELALMFILAPTPTALELKTEPEEGQTDLEATPTNNPAGQDGPTPTPPPEEGPPDPSASPVTGSGQPGGTYLSTPLPERGGEVSIEDAKRLLDSVQQNQQTMREYLEGLSTPGAPSGNDW